MKKQDALFQLIKSLTRGEKRNFRILAQLTAGDKKYLQLFDVIDNLDEYDEQKIIKKFKHDDKFEKQFAYNKNYLYNSILNSLAYFHKSIDAELSSTTMHVHILLEKNLYFQAKKQLNKAKEYALQRERFEEVLKLLRMEIDILLAVENIKLLPDSIREIEFAERVTLQKLDNLLTYRRLERQTHVLLASRHMARKENELEEVTKMLSLEALQDESQALSTRARIMYNDVHRRIVFYKGEHANAAFFGKRILALYEAAPAILEDDKLIYLKQIVLLAHHLLWSEGYEAALELLEKVKAAKISTPQERLARFEKYYVYLLSLKITMCETVSDAFLQEFADELDAVESDLAIETRINACYLYASYYMVMEDYSKALVWINRFLNHPRTNLRSDLQSSMRLMNLLTHFELGNYDLIEYNLKSTYRFIYKMERMHKYERRFIRFFRDAVALPDPQGLRQLMITFKQDIQEIVKDPFESRASDFYSILAWIDAKLEQVPLRVTRRREVDEIFGPARLQAQKAAVTKQ